MKPINEILKENPIVPSGCDGPKFEAGDIYFVMLKAMEALIKERNTDWKLILTDENKHVIGQVALWYSWDERFKGDVRKGLMIRGNVGTGKSLIVQALCKIIMAYEILVPCFLHASELYDLYMRGDVDGIDIAKKRAYTIIDDVGVEPVETKNYGNVKEPFNDVFDYRYRNNKRTIITTNLTPSEIEETYGTRIIDRFRECMNDLVLDGESFRR
jgi:DNA replication protein DnaC